MGNHHSHGAHQKAIEAPIASAPDSAQTNGRKAISRSASGADIQDRTPTQLQPIEKLAKILMQKSQEEDGIQGISCGAFCRYVFSRYQDFGEKLYMYLHYLSKAKTKSMGIQGFKQQCEKFLSIMDDSLIRDSYVKMYSEHSDNAPSDMMTQKDLRALLMTVYLLAMEHYSEGPQTCLMIQRTISAVVESCFHSKQILSVQYISHWLEAHCPRLILPLHRFTVHSLTTAYRVLEVDGMPAATGIDLATPILEQPPPFPNVNQMQKERLMPVSQAWLLAGALPPLYSRPKSVSPPSSSGVGLASHAFMAKLLSAVPSHWVLLYNSDQHGQGANRFLHHVLGYRGPTLILLRAEESNVFCVASPNEWKQSHLYWGDSDSVILQLLPKFSLIEKGPKILYLNTSIRGYPKGLRAGKDPRKPVISVDGGFEKVEYKNIPYTLLGIEVWGCGDPASREAQLDIKKWEVKEVERQRQVKLSAADWLDHPDRYLLELAGRQNYNNSES